MTSRRFPPPWQVKHTPGGFKVLDASGKPPRYLHQLQHTDRFRAHGPGPQVAAFYSALVQALKKQLVKAPSVCDRLGSKTDSDREVNMAHISVRLTVSALAVAVVSVAVVMHPSSPPPASAQAQFKKSTKPLTPQQAVPVEPGTQGTRIPGMQLRTACGNTTCHCTGDDCTGTWERENCKEGTYTCSQTEKETLCSCIKKAARN